MEEVVEYGQRQLIPCRVELASPEIDWEKSWRLARLPGLGPELTSFIFKLLHQVLPTQERVARTSPVVAPTCKSPSCTGGHIEDLQHALIHCCGNNGVGVRLVELAQVLAPGVGVDRLLHLDVVVEEDDEFACVWWLAAGLMAIWNLRKSGKKVEQYLVRAQLEAKINLLRETKYVKAVSNLDCLLTDM